MIAIRPGATVETRIEYPPDIAALRAEALVLIAQRMDAVKATCAQLTNPAIIRQQIDLANYELIPLRAVLVDLAVFAIVKMIVPKDDIVADAE